MTTNPETQVNPPTSPSDQQALISLTGVERSYKMGEVVVHALRGIDLEVYPGEVTIIMGPSGCGKTTLLNQIGGIDSPTEGSIRIDGDDIAKMSAGQLTQYRRDKIGFIFQFFNLIPDLTARENVEFVLEYVSPTPRKEIKPRVDRLLEQVGLTERGDHFPYQLSGGEQQRVSIARALAKEPRILLADEPTGELDYGTGKQILSLLADLAAEGRAVLIVTHNKELARMAHHVLRLRDGRIVASERNREPEPVADLEW